MGDLTEILDRNMKRQFLTSAPVLNSLNSSEIEKLINVIKLENFEENSQIIKEGDIGDTFYIIVKGSVKITKNIDGKETELKIMGINDHFGEKALIEDDRRSANVIAVGLVTCLTIQRKGFVELLGR